LSLICRRSSVSFWRIVIAVLICKSFLHHILIEFHLK
jgi:hypothetical protein